MSDPVRMTASQAVGFNLDRLRTVSRNEISRRTGWNNGSLSKVASGRQSVTVEQLMALARALDVPPIALLMPPYGSDLVVGPLQVGETTDGLSIAGPKKMWDWVAGSWQPWMAESINSRAFITGLSKSMSTEIINHEWGWDDER